MAGVTGLEPMTPRCKRDALPTELTAQSLKSLIPTKLKTIKIIILFISIKNK